MANEGGTRDFAEDRLQEVQNRVVSDSCLGPASMFDRQEGINYGIQLMYHRELPADSQQRIQAAESQFEDTTIRLQQDPSNSYVTIIVHADKCMRRRADEMLRQYVGQGKDPSINPLFVATHAAIAEFNETDARWAAMISALRSYQYLFGRLIDDIEGAKKPSGCLSSILPVGRPPLGGGKGEAEGGSV
jgi:hypothetical protein